MERAVKGLVLTQLWRLRGARIEDRLICSGVMPQLHLRGELLVGSRVTFRNERGRSAIGVNKGARLAIGERTLINTGTNIQAHVDISIGAHCLIGEGVEIQDSNYHEVDEKAGVKQAAITLGRNVWIGNRAVVLPGVTIGDHSVVAAGAIVTKDVPARSVVAGNPARVVRQLTCANDFVRP